MESKHRELLSQHRMRFIREVDVQQLLPFLQAGEVLDAHDVESVTREPSPGAQVRSCHQRTERKKLVIFESEKKKI